jgi:hypothetical protein
MKMLRAPFILMALSVSLVACGVGEEEASPEGGSLESQEQLMCEPGPSTNWCENVEGTSCSASWRRCYLPNYCEWLLCHCVNGAWDCELP